MKLPRSEAPTWRAFWFLAIRSLDGGNPYPIEEHLFWGHLHFYIIFFFTLANFVRMI
jgi:hypothetical protein